VLAVSGFRAAGLAVGATQFETVTAAAFADFAARGVEHAAIEAGLGGRHDATNVIDAQVVLLTNVALEHTEVLGGTRAEIAAEKLAVAGRHATVVLPDLEFAPLLAGRDVRIGGAREAAEALLGRPVAELAEGPLPGRFELRGEEVWDGAHTPEAVDWLLERLPEPREYVVVAAILGDKDADGILERLSGAGRVLVATRSSNARSLAAGEVAARARTWFPRVETAAEPRDALRLARSIAPRILVTGSLYLLADLTASE
jgi:dihydrofolate synthase/folylpolyglutamate synthase